MSQLDAAFLKAVQNSDARAAAAGFLADLGRLVGDPTVDRSALGHQLLISAEDIAGAIVKNTVADDNKPFQPINQVSTLAGQEPNPNKLPSTEAGGGAVVQNNTVVSGPTQPSSPPAADTHGSPSTATGLPVTAGASQHPPSVAPAASPSTAPAKR